MTVISAEKAPTFETGHATITGLAAPSRGAIDTSVWRVKLNADEPSPPHSVTREEVFVVIDGTLAVRYEDRVERAHAGGALIVPAGESFSLAAIGGPAEAVCVLPVGGRAVLNGDVIVPPWAQ